MGNILSRFQKKLLTTGNIMGMVASEVGLEA